MSRSKSTFLTMAVFGIGVAFVFIPHGIFTPLALLALSSFSLYMGLREPT